MVDLLGRIGQLERAVAVVMRVPFHPTAVMWKSLLGACQRWGPVELAREAFKNAMLLDESDASTYIFMSNIYAEAGMHKDSNKVEQMRIIAGVEEAKITWG